MKWAFLISLVLMLGMVGPVQAQDVDVTVESDVNVESRSRFEERQEIRIQRQTDRQEAQDARQDAAEERQAEREANQAAREEAREERIADRCEQITNRVETRLNNYEERKNTWANKYNRISSRVENLASKLEERGCDTSQIEEDLATFDGLINDFAASFRLFIDDLNGSKAYACGESEGEFRGQLTTSRASLSEAKAAGAELRDFVQNTLKPNLKSAGEACREQAANS